MTSKPLNKHDLDLVKVFVDAVVSGTLLDAVTKADALAAAKRLEADMVSAAKRQMPDAYYVFYNIDKPKTPDSLDFFGTKLPEKPVETPPVVLTAGVASKHYYKIYNVRNVKIGYMLIDENNYPIVIPDPTAHSRRAN